MNIVSNGLNALPDTFPRLLHFHAQNRPHDTALREKAYGIWQTWSWQRVCDDVHALAAGFAALGFSSGQNLALIGDNRPFLYMSMLAVQSLGGVPIVCYQDSSAAELAFVLKDADVHFVFAENQEQVDKVLAIRAGVCDAGESIAPLDGIAHIIYDDPRGMRRYTDEGLIDVQGLLALGREYDKAHPDLLSEMLSTTSGDDLAVILYTSGTTSKPKGVCHSHANFISAARGGVKTDGLNPRDNVLSYLSPAWVGDFLFSVAQWLVAGFCINCPESGDTVQIDMREIGPSYYFAPPRVFEAMLTKVATRMQDASAFKQWLYKKSMEIAKRWGADILAKKPVGIGARALYFAADFVMLAPLKNAMGLSKIRVAYTAGAAIGPDLLSFYRSMGVNLKQLYGQTETCAYVCLQTDGDVRPNSVGAAAPFMNVRIADSGEVLVKGASLLKSYYKRPEDTKAAFDENGYFKTGDAGFLDGEGNLHIIDRVKDVGKTATGAMFAPNYLENKLKFFPHIQEAVCIGDGMDSVCALINIDFTAMTDWAFRAGITYTSYVDLAGKPEVLEFISSCIAKVNEDLACEDGMQDVQIARFLILHKELDADDGELTRTKKVRRGFVNEKYKVLIDAMYAGKSEQFIETKVTFEDGKSGQISATLKIIDAQTFGSCSRK